MTIEWQQRLRILLKQEETAELPSFLHVNARRDGQKRGTTVSAAITMN
jgi:hypothetical protein